jgi:SAM-dependent methyltransferase
MKYINLFEYFKSNKSELINYINNFNIEKVQLPFSKKEYESFVHNLSPETHDEDGRLKDSEYYNGFLYNSEKYCREVTSNYEYLKLVKYLFDFNSNYKFYDLGCGIGSLLYFVKKIGYKNTVGVEYQEELVKIHKKLNLDVIYGDLLKMDLSFLKDADIIYLYKPIYDDSLANKLIDKILKNTKDSVVIIYCDPDEYFYDREIISTSNLNQYILLK